MDDLISRQALRSEMYHEAFEKDSNEQRWDSGCWIRYKMFERVVERLPSAQRTGRWIWSEEEWGYRCSECRVKFDYDKTYELFDHGFMLANYCPNCGAQMEGEEE